jgi:alpha-ketoglutarate-dependent taurine dioxygenase
VTPHAPCPIDGLSDVYGIDELPGWSTAHAPAPLVLTPLRRPGVPRLSRDAIRAIAAAIATRAAVLIRGLGAANAGDVAELAGRIFADEPPFSTGEHPPADGNAALYRPVRFAPAETLLWHHENSFNADWPRYILFACAVPAGEGGETTIVDSRRVYAQMPQDVRGPLAQHGIRYERLCDGRTSRTWDQIYGTTDRDEARRLAEANGEELTFAADGARIRAIRPAFLTVACGTSWFNQVLHWHPHALPDGLRQLVADGLAPTYRACHVGDGSEITVEAVELLVQAHREAELAVRWAAGDVLLIDNTVVAHGRRPYRGQREHFVWMAGRGHHAPTAPGNGR